MVDIVQSFYPEMKPVKTGYGAGTKDFEAMANVVRLVLGEPVGPFFRDEEIVVLETNVDDVSGEVLGHSINKIMEAGAKDVCIIPTTTKKNRPGYVIKVITSRENEEKVTLSLMEETGTLGVRVYTSQRHVLVRSTQDMRVELDGEELLVRVKVSRTLDGRVIQSKPEYEDLSKIAEKTGKPLRVVMDLLKEKVTKELRG